jgi:hypothetical protein
MITSTNKQKIAKKSTHSRNDWDFLPTAFSAIAGVTIGLMLGSYLGWI